LRYTRKVSRLQRSPAAAAAAAAAAAVSKLKAQATIHQLQQPLPLPVVTTAGSQLLLTSYLAPMGQGWCATALYNECTVSSEHVVFIVIFATAMQVHTYDISRLTTLLK
jgi:hypothetical protein